MFCWILKDLDENTFCRAAILVDGMHHIRRLEKFASSVHGRPLIECLTDQSLHEKILPATIFHLDAPRPVAHVPRSNPPG